MTPRDDAEHAPSAPLLCRVRGFGKRYGRLQAVKGIDLELHQGEIHGLIGPDGAGKSTLMKAIAGVLDFDQGRIELFGTPLDSERAAEAAKAQIGFMPQGLGLNLYAELSVEENIDFFAQLREIPPALREARKAELLAMTRLAPFRDRAMKHLSGGMKQKLGLVCTLVHQPRLVILDEPTTGVDPVSRRDFWAILTGLLRERGVTALVSTAYLDEASRFHRLAFLHQGRMLAEGSPERLQRLAPGHIAQLAPADPLAAFRAVRSRWPQAEVVGPLLRVFLREGEEPAELARRAVVGEEEITLHEPDLEDTFIALLRQRGLMEERAEESGSASGDQGDPAGETRRREPLIEARGLTRDFGRFRAVDHVDFQVCPGEIFGLLGANGAGKTTAIKMLTGILPPSSGEGRVAGADMARAGQAIKSRIGYMSQAFSLYEDLTVQENLRLFAGIYGLRNRERDRRIEWALELGDLTHLRRASTASLPMGQRQRLALGCALLHRPQVLFLDEPTSGVDPVGRRRFWEILLRLARIERVALLVTTHYMSEAEHCDRIALMYAGRIIADAPPAELKARLERRVGRLLSVVTAEPLRALERLEAAGFRDAALFGRHIHLFSRDPGATGEEIRRLLEAAHIAVEGIGVQPPGMEDVFVHEILAREREAVA